MMYKRKPIWLFQGGRKKVIVKGAISATNSRLYYKMLDKLDDIDNYVRISRELCPGHTEERTERWGGGIQIYENYPYETKEYVTSHWKTCYINPRREVRSLFESDKYEPYSELISLFKCLDRETTCETLPMEFSDAQKMINQLARKSFDCTSFKKEINKLWPNFGFFVCECLKCIEIVPEASYDIDELTNLAKRCEELNFEVPKEIREILSYQTMAKSNTKVLSLAKKAHGMIYNKK